MPQPSTVPSPEFESVREWDDEFLALFPHRYDYIWAEHSEANSKTKLEWKTESRHPLSDRLVHQGTHLYGVRFGAETSYCMVDIDADSIYHPKRDPFAIGRMVAALEAIGLVSYVACTSSYSGGLHLYFPFPSCQKTWQVAIALQTVLENAGFKPVLGQLELFPNAKRYVVDGQPSLYAAHRLPMQMGSYLLTSSWELTYSTPTTFLELWKWGQQRNDFNSSEVERLLKAARRKQFNITGKADKFLNDLNADIEPGWTGFGQTNTILGRIALRSYIFGHVLYAAQPLVGKALEEDIVRIAKSLPGYYQWCKHQHEIEKRAEEWARCVESSRYFPFGFRSIAASQQLEASTQLTVPQLTAPQLTVQPSWNQRQAISARQRIQSAIADLLHQNLLPATPTARFRVLLTYGIGGGSLYRHRDLWHPQFLSLDSHSVDSLSLEGNGEAGEIPPNPPASSEDGEGIVFENIPSPCPTSLLEPVGGNSLPHQDCSPLQQVSTTATGGNCPQGNGSVGSGMEDVPGGDRYAWIFTQQEAGYVAKAHASTLRAQARQEAYIVQMQRYLDSGDPILMAEALAWNAINPGVLHLAKAYTVS